MKFVVFKTVNSKLFMLSLLSFIIIGLTLRFAIKSVERDTVSCDTWPHVIIALAKL